VLPTSPETPPNEKLKGLFGFPGSERLVVSSGDIGSPRLGLAEAGLVDQKQELMQATLLAFQRPRLFSTQNAQRSKLQEFRRVQEIEAQTPAPTM
jgi:hypothetical protein